ncbi:MAG: hypothetical protein GW858_08265 [Sphingomonadales bacterium]|nr:hypothetical protein [Sphingomonadales bacterium]NCQ21021.1 hypothetical protein [Sphingomonadales bacterium]NCT03810.1 hypothetical protein [Sphingomonadales bacterium]
MNMKMPFKQTVETALVAVACVSVMIAAPVLASGVTAGTLIKNTAIASYEEGGVERQVNSNTITVRVDELIDVTLTSLDTGPVGARPGDSVLTYELTNQGNGPEAYRMIANTVIGGNAIDFVLRAIANDSNGNGIYDEGVDEILGQPQTTAILAPDQRLTLFVLVTAPDGVSDQQASAVTLSAEAVTGTGAPGTAFAGEGVDGGDAIVGPSGGQATARSALITGIASVALVKSVVLSDPFGGTSAVPGTIATFTIEARVSGTGTIDNLVVTDAIPEGTTYAPGTLALDGVGLSDAADGDAGVASDTSGISVTLGTVAAQTTQRVSFNVVVE